MPDKLIGGKQPPWAIVVLPEDSVVEFEALLRPGLERHFTRVEFVSTEGASDLHQGEYDAAIVIGDPPNHLSRNLNVLQFGGSFLAVDPQAIPGLSHDDPAWSRWRLFWFDGPTAKQFRISQAAIDGGLAALAEATLRPAEGVRYKHLDWQLINGSAAELPVHTALTPFLVDSAGRVLAARLQRGDTPDDGELWCLPADAANAVEEWVAAAIRHWRAAGQEAFADADAWTEDPSWTTHIEDRSTSEYRTRLDAIEVQRAELTAELEGLLAAREDARRQADSNERRLLTAQGPELVEEVSAALGRLGFEVIDADTLPQHSNGRKQEDLRITDEAWTCLVEIKGYAKGNAKTGDLLQLGKAVTVFVLHEQREPDAQWYVVNQSFQMPPADRPEPFAGAREEVEIFAGNNGLVIDTRALFTLDKDVQAGVLTPLDARRMLREARGVLRYPSGSEEGGA
ncbi:hypothetical protein [Kribbella sp. HUAS MG21]|uniref:Restriction endonuclease type IV Mrr domain-containing protein n=1 Tax=Kribbella sp. HUAS MG21 TaxID=3160966 RepID=A0AAU7TIM6_9ACTN